MIPSLLLLNWLGLGCVTEEVYVLVDTATSDCAAVSYTNVGEPFMTQYCIGCHGTMSANRQGAPNDVTLDSLENIEEHIEAIRGEIVLGDMPPSGGVTPENIELMVQWLDCEVTQ